MLVGFGFGMRLCFSVQDASHGATDDFARSSQYGIVAGVRSTTLMGTKPLSANALKYSLRGWMLQM